MNKLLPVFLVLLIICPVVHAGDYIKLCVPDTVLAGSTIELEFLAERTCPSPALIMGIANCFNITTTGEASIVVPVVFEVDPIWIDDFEPGGLLITDNIDGISPDYFCIGGAFLPPSGLPIFTEAPFFTQQIHVGPGEGEICIDSGFVEPAGSWKWSGMTCGLGGAPDRPLFLDCDGSDDNHPICITVVKPNCGDANSDGAVDIDDVVFLIAFIFSGGQPPIAESADVDRSGEVDIDDVVFMVNFIFGGGPAPCSVAHVFGSMYWPGHELSHPIALLDTSHTSVMYPANAVYADAEGSFMFELALDGLLEAFVVGCDDVDGDGWLEAGEPLGWWDVVPDGQWMPDDMITIDPGETVEGVEIELMQSRDSFGRWSGEPLRLRE